MLFAFNHLWGKIVQSPTKCCPSEIFCGTLFEAKKFLIIKNKSTCLEYNKCTWHLSVQITLSLNYSKEPKSVTSFNQPTFFHADINQSEVEDSFQLASDWIKSVQETTSFPGFSSTRPTELHRVGRREPWERGCTRECE